MSWRKEPELQEKMERIDLCKLRPGDVIFSRAPACVSRSIALVTGSAYSHAMIVVYPDIWFETDGAGSGFKLIEHVTCFEVRAGNYAILADLPYVRMDILRPATSVSSSRILASVQSHIALRYPDMIQFIPLFLPLRPFPKFSRGLVSLLSRKSEDVGGYCSQMVSQILRDLFGLSVGGQDDHISPGMLRRRLLRSCGATRVGCSVVEIPDDWKRSSQLAGIYDNLLRVTSKLKAYQYPHNRASFEGALAETFKAEGIDDDPKQFSVSAPSLRSTLTKPDFFRMHEWMWSTKYT